jgi:acyl-[acyl carrier protein]--UDP-N-acetylglucosamine O-acyltransferase
LIQIGKNFRKGLFCDLGATPLMAEYEGNRRVLIPATKGIVIGDGVTFGSGVTINNGVKNPTRIGDGCFIWHKVNVGHDRQIGAKSILNVGAVLCGEVVIGENTYVAPGAMIQPRCRIGSYVMIGTMSNVIHDTVIPDGEVWFGNPARRQRLNTWRPPE